MPRGTRAEATTEARERILQAALEAFAENGFDGSKTRDIAARAKVNLGLVQYYFGTKLELWKAAVDHACGELVEGLTAVLASPDDEPPRERIARVIRAHCGFVSRHPEFARLMHEEGKRKGPRMRWLVDRYVKPMHEAMLPLVRSAQEQGVLPHDIAPLHFVYAMVGAVDLIFHQAEECKRVSGLDPTEQSVAEAHARAVEHLFLGPKPEESSR